MNELLLTIAAETEGIMGVWCGKCKSNEQESDTNLLCYRATDCSSLNKIDIKSLIYFLFWIMQENKRLFKHYFMLIWMHPPKVNFIFILVYTIGTVLYW